MRAAITKAVLVIAVMIVSTAFAAENFTPEKIKEMLPGKTKQEVKELLGSPTAVSTHENDESGQWVYATIGGVRQSPVILKGRIIYDEVTDKAVSNVTIWFKNGTVLRVQLSY